MAREDTDTIRVIVCRPMERAEVIEIGDDLRSMQEVVGGMIEEYQPFYDPDDERVEDVAIVCDEEGPCPIRYRYCKDCISYLPYCFKTSFTP